MTSGGQCVMTAGAVLMQLWFVCSWDMHTLEVSGNNGIVKMQYFIICTHSKISNP